MLKRKEIDNINNSIWPKKLNKGENIVELYYFKLIYPESSDSWKVAKFENNKWRYKLQLASPQPENKNPINHENRMSKNLQNLMWSEDKSLDEIVKWIVERHKYIVEPQLTFGSELDCAIFHYYHKKESEIKSRFLVPILDFYSISINRITDSDDDNGGDDNGGDGGDDNKNVDNRKNKMNNSNKVKSRVDSDINLPFGVVNFTFSLERSS